MWLMKNISVYLIIIVASVLAADSVQATDVIEGWVGRYNGPGNATDAACAVAVDAFDNIYVTGYSSGSGTYYDIATIKYDSAGNQLWVRRYNGADNTIDYSSAIVLDNSGNIYVTGQSNDDYVTIKYDSNGTECWVRTYDGPGNNIDYAHAIAADSSGNVYVTGGSYGSGTGADYATIKYDANGTQKWVARYNGPVNSGDVAYAIKVDSLGNSYVTGGSVGSSTGSDYATIKYDPNGTEVWVRRYSRLSNDYAYALVLDSSDNVYVTGKSYSSSTGYDYATVKYDKDSNQKWAATYDAGNGDDSPSAIALDSSGNVYVTGSGYIVSTGYDYVTIKYDSASNLKWVRKYNGSGTGTDSASGIITDNSGNVYVTGISAGSGTGVDYATIKYDANGTPKWILRYNGPANGDDYAYGIAKDSLNNIYVAGQSVGSTTQADYLTIQYNQNSPFFLTMQTTPSEVNTVTPMVGSHPYASGVTAHLIARRFVNCPHVYVFNHWAGDVNDPTSAQTTTVMNADKIITAVYVDGRQCGDECHPYPIFDLDKDCKVTFGDLAIFADHWMECTRPECD